MKSRRIKHKHVPKEPYREIKVARIAAWEARQADQKEQIILVNTPIYDARRVALLSLGYETWKDYLESYLWKKLAGKVLLKVCELCKNTSTKIYHLDFDKTTLDGTDQSALIALCNRCYRYIEYAHNSRRSLRDARVLLTKKLTQCKQREMKGKSLLFKERKPKAPKLKNKSRRCTRCKNKAVKGTKYCRPCAYRNHLAKNRKLLESILEKNR